jgi:hypothetical protein
MSEHTGRGGSYVREKDGTLRRVAFTRPQGDTSDAIRQDADTMSPADEIVPDAQAERPAKGRKSKE